MNDKLRTFPFEHLAHRLPVSDVYGQVPVTRQRRTKLLDDRMRGALLPEELPPHVIIDPDNLPPRGRELADAFRTD